MKWNLIIGISMLIIGGIIGWTANSWRMGEQAAVAKSDQLEQDMKEANEVVTRVNTRLQDIINQVQTASDASQITVDNLAKLDAQNRVVIEGITKRTREFNNEIANLSAPTCVIGADYGRVWQQVGEAANAGRGSLFGTQAKSGN